MLRQSGEQLGYLEARVASELAADLDGGETIACRIADITGLDRPTRGVNIYIGEYAMPQAETVTGATSAVVALLTLIGIVAVIAWIVSAR